MKNKKVIIFLVIINIILMGIICSLISKNGNIIKDKQIIKEMTETEYDNSITTLNKSHEEYALQIQENKIKIASAITEMGVETSEDVDVDTMVSNIKSIIGNCNFKIVLSIVHQTGYHDYNSEGYTSTATTTVQIIRNNDDITATFLSNPSAQYFRGHADNIYYTFSKILSITITSFEII